MRILTFVPRTLGALAIIGAACVVRGALFVVESTAMVLGRRA
ncbi:MAG TPA: hypothetical protein VFQ42_21905 [Mycobacterium sp.]|nr:hypothetical protein [Mycobacterium sp.]